MMAMPHSGFVFLSMTKTGSTAIHQHFSRHAQVLARNPPRMKHMTAKTFTELVVPLLERYGRPRESYELMCIAREPVDWVGSWWRYRARPAMEGKPKSTANLSFDAFAEQIVNGKVKLGSSANFVSDKDGKVIVDRIYKFEHLDLAAQWMASQLKIEPPQLRSANVSPARENVISPSTRRLLEEHYAADLAVYESAI